MSFGHYDCDDPDLANAYLFVEELYAHLRRVPEYQSVMDTMLRLIQKYELDFLI